MQTIVGFEGPSAPPPQFLPDSHYEVVDGQVIETQPISARAVVIANRISQKIANHAESKKLGFAAMELLFRLPLPKERQRRPDVAFVSSERWPMETLPPETDNALAVVPDLFVEVVSPTDLAEDIHEKLHEYFTAGARQVWIVYPNRGMIEIFESPVQSRWLSRNDVLEGISFLPDFRLPLLQIFGPAPD